MKLLVVIVNYRATELTINCLRSLRPQIAEIPGAGVAVCENGSGDDAVAKLATAIDAEGWNDWVRLTTIHPNRGFAGGNNVVLREALAAPEPWEYFLLLNADTIVRPDALRLMLDAIEKRPDVGIVGPRLEWESGEPQVSHFRFHSPVSEFLRGAQTGPITRLLRRHEVPIPATSQPFEPDWVSFACALIRRAVLEQIGLLDGGFYLYFDDPDYCRRAGQAGWKVLYWPAAHVVHLRGRSNPVKTLSAARKRLPPYWYASRARYYAKFYGRAGLWAANLLWLMGRSISLTRELVGNKQPHTCEKEWRGIWTNSLQPLSSNGRHGTNPP